jgi:putative transposase
MIQSTETLGREVGVRAACTAVGVARSSLYAARQPHPPTCEQAPARPANALSLAERTTVWETLSSSRFADQTPYEIVPQLLDEGQYLGSIRTYYRVLAENQALPERRDVLRRTTPAPVPRLTATQPLRVWTWDITQFGCLIRGVVLYLYLVLDLFSRYLIGWLVAERQSGTLAEQLLAECYQRWHITPGQLTVHNDNGGPMIAQPMTALWPLLGIEPSRSRPHVSNDNPFSESAFKTVKYHPTFPGRFADHSHATVWMRALERWYNWRHAHTGLALMTPAAVHFGFAENIWRKRQAVLQAAYHAHPERFSRGLPTLPRWPDAVHINPLPVLRLPGDVPIEVP